MTTQEEFAQSLAVGGVWSYSESVTIPALTTYIIGFKTGAYGVSLEDRQFSTTGEDVLILLYDGVNYTGGTDDTAAMQCRNRVLGNVASRRPLTEVFTGVTASPGVPPITGAQLLFANKAAGGAGNDAGGAEIQLAPLLSHVITLANNHVNPATVNVFGVFRSHRRS